MDLRQSTLATVMVGPFMDDSDGKTAEIGLTITASDVNLSKHGAAWAASSGAGTLAHGTQGWYACPIDTADTDTIGRLQLEILESGALSVFHEFMVKPANAFDAQDGTDYLKTDATEIEGTDATNQLDARIQAMMGTTLVSVGRLAAQGSADVNAAADTALTDYDPPTRAELDTAIGTAKITVGANNDKTGYSLAADQQVDVTKISGDSTAANNLELQYDGTGYVADTAPATQSQLASVTNVGSAVSVHPKAEPNGFVITVGGAETNDEDSTFALDGTKHTLADNGSGVLDCYYEFDIGAGIPTSVTHKGYITGKSDDVGVYGYNWVTTTWVQIGTLEGKNAATIEVNSYDMFTNMVGFGANEGTVRVKFYAASGLSTALLATDQIVLSFSRGNEGYDDGAIWIDTTYSNTGTVVGIDGTSRNPVSTIAAANTLSASTNLNIFHIAPGSTITFAASQDDQIFLGHDWTLALGGQSISGSYIEGAIVSGIATGASPPTFVECTIGTVTLPPCEFRRCGIASTITGGSAGNYHFNGCFSEVAGTGTPIFDFGSGVASTNLNMRHYSGGIDLRNMGQSDTDTASIEGFGQVIINANCIGGTLVIRGMFTVTNNGTLDTLTTDYTATRAGYLDNINNANLATLPAITAARVGYLDNINNAHLLTLSREAVGTAVLDRIIAEPSGVWAWANASVDKVIGWMGALARNKITQTATTKTLRNDADNTDIATSTVSDDATTATRGEWT